MVKSPTAIYKPPLSRVRYERFIRFVKVGAFLHVMALAGVLLTLISAKIALEFHMERFVPETILWGIISLCAFTVPFFAELDAYGRFQNYKQVKDSLYSMGFDKRLVRPFLHSKCQRDAVIIAGEDLQCATEVKDFFHAQGYRWYHILPDAFIRNPFVLLHRLFWKRILFTKRYELKNFYW